MKSLILALALTLSPLVHGGVLPPEQVEDERIVGGTEAEDHAYPFQVSIRRAQHSCGGAILNQWFILTAAHCLDRYGPNVTTVLVGTNSLGNVGGAGTVYACEEFIVHENFSRDTMENDIGLIRLATPLSFQQANVQPIPLQTTVDEDPVPVTLTGWGLTNYWNAVVPDRLQRIDLVTVPREECHQRLADIWPYTDWTLTECHVCAMHELGVMHGACSGDSGGSLVAYGRSMGVVSWGVPCGEGYPDVYTRVSCYADWIKRHLENRGSNSRQ